MLILMAAPQHAEAAARPSGITVSPAFQQISVDAQAATQTVTFAITNNKPSAQAFDLSVSDFSTLGDSGGLFFAGTNPTALQKKYGLASWADLPVRHLTAQPGQTQTVQLTIRNSADLSPGGHYGALMLAVHTPSGNTAVNGVALHPVASALMFVTKLGGDTHRLRLSGVTLDRNLFAVPDSAVLHFYNDGNTHVVPRGIVTVTAGSGATVSKGIINENSELILPESSRLFSVPLAPLRSPLWPERYHVRVAFRFDGYQQFRYYQTALFVVPLQMLLIVAVGVAACFFFAKFWLASGFHRRRGKARTSP